MTNITIQNIVEAREVLISQRIELKKELDYLDCLLSLSEQLLNDELYNPAALDTATFDNSYVEPLSSYVVTQRGTTVPVRES